MNHDDTNLCLRLDAHFDGELSRQKREAFVSHLEQCSACREAVDQQRWIDGLLTSEAASQLEKAPRLPKMPMRCPSRRTWLPLAAAAALAALVALPLLTPHRGDAPGAGPLSSPPSAPTLSSNEGAVSPAPAPPPSNEAAPGATFISTGASIAIQAYSPSPEVTVVQIYPTLPPSRSTRRASAVDFFHPSPNGG